MSNEGTKVLVHLLIIEIFSAMVEKKKQYFWSVFINKVVASVTEFFLDW